MKESTERLRIFLGVGDQVGLLVQQAGQGLLAWGRITGTYQDHATATDYWTIKMNSGQVIALEKGHPAIVEVKPGRRNGSAEPL